MPNAVSIRILERDNNRRGDLFNRLMGDLFVALGYEQPTLNVHYPGHEIDIDAEHRLEKPRRVYAECKATEDPVGGPALNLFAGVLDLKRAAGTEIIGYYISLNGFRETALKQEEKRRPRIVTLDGQQVVDELIKGKRLVPKDRAAEQAGRCCPRHDDLVLDPAAAVLAHDCGLLWAIYYTQGKIRTHFVLVHADGRLLAAELAEEVNRADQACQGQLHALVCLNPPSRLPPHHRVAAAIAAYRHYVAEECGYIALDGLAADRRGRLPDGRLEHFFVPLHFDVANGQERKERQPLGNLLTAQEHPRIALLAPPGGGKSTLIKRLALAYAHPVRRVQIADNLPARDWLPLFFRCRELRGLAGKCAFDRLLDACSRGRRRNPTAQSGLPSATLGRPCVAGRPRPAAGGRAR